MHYTSPHFRITARASHKRQGAIVLDNILDTWLLHRMMRMIGWSTREQKILCLSESETKSLWWEHLALFPA